MRNGPKNKPETPDAALARIAAGYKLMPNGGAALLVSNDGSISNGMIIITRFVGRPKAEAGLRRHGFHKRNDHWYLNKVKAK